MSIKRPLMPDVKPLLQAMNEVLDAIEEPIAKWMREYGCDPRKGWVLYLPSHMVPAGYASDKKPSYVKFHNIVMQPCLAQSANMPTLC